jgi:hypothetical protein
MVAADGGGGVQASHLSPLNFWKKKIEGKTKTYQILILHNKSTQMKWFFSPEYSRTYTE